MAKKGKRNFCGRPDRACSMDELRESMNYIFIDDGCMVATNGHMLVKIPLVISSLIGDISLLEGCYIHRRQYMEIIKYDNVQILGSNEIKASNFMYSTIFKLKTRNDFSTPFPDYKKVLEFKSEAIEKIGISQFVIKQMMSCFDGIESFGRWEMEFQKPNQSIHFHSPEHNGLFGLLMPVMLNHKEY